ncbi:RNA polymerase sigma factor [Gynurincola endophyticus]|jgi:RNA polymerase sigma factor (sigma-70 family)|uniref:RNA polymerase sigma factor n=1 Tax=Gynurincola endophyticus TaxID=2479004 RepID=UPI000F8EE929|nr:RNA polymerase sigma factor [Gynurincola endophyticus]
MNYTELVKDCVRGKAKAQKQLYDMFAENMLGVCYRYTRSLTDAEDVLQDGFVKVFQNLHQYKFEGELGGWIRRIMVNTALNYLKRESRYHHDEIGEDSSYQIAAKDNPELHLSAKEIAQLIRKLPTGYRTIFNLHAVEGFTHVEIAKMLEINEGTSRSQYARARNLLIQWYNQTQSFKVSNYVGE